MTNYEFWQVEKYGNALPAAEFTPGVYAEPVTNETAYIFNIENLPA